MNPKQFLTWGGIILVLVAVLGWVGLIGPTDQSVFGSAWYFDVYENWAHLVLGVVALLAAFWAPANLQKPLVIVVGVVALFFSAYNLYSTDFYGAMLQNPWDMVLHLVVGVWALWAGLRKSDMVVA